MKSVNIIVLLFLFNCLVSGQSTKVSIGNLNAFNGDSVVVPINVSDFYNVGAVTLKLEIDPNVLLWGRSLNWNPSMNGGLSGYKNNSVIIAWDGINGVNIQAGEIVQLKFKYISGSSDIKFVVSACEIADVEGNLLNISYVNGTVSQTPVPAEPVLLSPENNKTNTAVNLQFDWNDVPNAYNYNFQLATDVNFTNIFAYASHLNLSQVDIFNLANETNYFWRVKANNPTGSGNWSQVFTFTTIVNIPDKPVLIFPMNNSLNNLTTIQFRWKKVNKAQKYFYELSKDSLFSALVEKDTTLTDTIKSTLKKYITQ